MSTLKVTNIAGLTGSSTNVIEGLAKAWNQFNGTGTLAVNDSFNTSSVTDVGTGNYSPNFSNSMSNAYYAVAAFTDQIPYHNPSSHTRSTTAYQFLRLAHDAAVADVSQAGLAIHGDLA